MEFSHKEDIEAPLERVFQEISDFDQIERSVMRRGIEVSRTDDMAAPGEGMSWRAGFTFRGKAREATIRLSRYEPPTLMVFESRSGGLEARSVVECVALSRTRTRISFDVFLTPKTLSARLIVQSMKLAKGKIDRKFRGRMADAATELERRIKTA
ncbi:Polyketide cyclase / dehydrase and lipid transport [Roseivivax sp. THAF40]|uniref:SRPBCC family protein n=1 Tax=unclassified Roseivivax TaxID=2639302 RepID=UPI001267D40B|nr:MULTISPECIES: SRPBCC family protein [unclassified Roseivivax]QFS81592.1 Polyketide cyclase / dehydrase and lipid transport [Roseivivax sp. THAF197b]QFT45321.1 Polyketide cyclase / dehydrase and lipid transport [Roseivivax sp. THAF40]